MYENRLVNCVSQMLEQVLGPDTHGKTKYRRRWTFPAGLELIFECRLKRRANLFISLDKDLTPPDSALVLNEEAPRMHHLTRKCDRGRSAFKVPITNAAELISAASYLKQAIAKERAHAQSELQ